MVALVAALVCHKKKKHTKKCNIGIDDCVEYFMRSEPEPMSKPGARYNKTKWNRDESTKYFPFTLMT